MYRQHCNKLIICIALVTVLFMSITTCAFADPFAGAMGAAMSASGVDVAIGGLGATTNAYSTYMNGVNTDPVSDLDPLGDYNVYFQKNYTTKTEGGQTVSYDLVYLSHDFAQYLKDEGIAFITNNNITSNSQGNLAEGLGTYDGLPLYLESGETIAHSAVYWFKQLGTYSFGSRTVVVEDNSSSTQTRWNYKINRLGYLESFYSLYTNNTNLQAGLRVNVTVSNNHVTLSKTTNGTSWSSGMYQAGTYDPVAYLDLTPFDFTYVAGNIDLNPVDSNKGLYFLIPSTVLGATIATGTYNTNDHAATVTGIMAGATTAGSQNNIKDAAFVASIIPPTPTPTPTPTPYPTDALGDIPYDTFMGDFQQAIDDQTEDINDTIGLGVGVIEGAIDTVGQSIEDKLDDVQDTIDTVGQSIEDKLDDVADSVSDTVGTQTNTIVGWLQRILSAINEGVADIVDAIEGIAEAVLEAIESFFETLFGDIQSAFGGWIADISDAFGIWHYVVEWLSCISTYFTFLRTIASGMPACFWSPVLALVAGTIVLGVYKRFLQ